MAKKCPPASRFFVAVAQSDFPDQMDVVRWLERDASYNVVAIEHTEDTYTAEEIAEREQTPGDGYFTRKNGDGSESQFRAGDVKPPHWHLLIQTQTKTRASTLCNRFCEQLYFLTANEMYGDQYEAARYLTHECFRARAKHQYSRSLLRFWGASSEAAALYSSLMQTDDTNLLRTVKRFKSEKAEAHRTLSHSGAEYDEKSAQKLAMYRIIEAGDIEVLKSVMAHGYFYSEFL